MNSELLLLVLVVRELLGVVFGADESFVALVDGVVALG